MCVHRHWERSAVLTWLFSHQDRGLLRHDRCSKLSKWWPDHVNARCRASNLLGYQAVLANEVGDQLLLGVRHVVASLNTLILPDVWGQVIIIPFQETQYPEQAPWQIHISYASTSR